MASDRLVPAYGVFPAGAANYTDGRLLILPQWRLDYPWHVAWQQGTPYNIFVTPTFYVNGPVALPGIYDAANNPEEKHLFARCYSGKDKPALALTDDVADQRPHMGQTCGLKPTAGPGTSIIDHDFKVSVGLPGFRALCHPFQLDVSGTAPADWVVWVVAESQVTGGWWCVATEDWQDGPSASLDEVEPWVKVNPCTTGNTYDQNYKVYDGLDLTEIEFRVLLPRMSGLANSDPNVREGNIFRYAASPDMVNRGYWSGTGQTDIDVDPVVAVAVSPGYLDDKIGTIKFWDGIDDDIPQGWEHVSNMDDSFLRAAADGSAGDTGTFATDIGTGTDYDWVSYVLIRRTR